MDKVNMFKKKLNHILYNQNFFRYQNRCLNICCFIDLHVKSSYSLEINTFWFLYCCIHNYVNYFFFMLRIINQTYLVYMYVLQYLHTYLDYLDKLSYNGVDLRNHQYKNFIHPGCFESVSPSIPGSISNYIIFKLYNILTLYFFNKFWI